MMRRKITKILSSCLIIALSLQVMIPLTTTASTESTSAETASTEVASDLAQGQQEAEEKKNELTGELIEIEDKIGNLKEEQSELENYVEELDIQLNSISSRLEDLNSSLADTETRIAETKELLEEAKGQESSQYEAMKKRIRYMYESGEYAYIEMIFSSTSISDLLNSAEYVTKISEYDRNMLVKYQEIKTAIVDKTKVLETEYEESQTLQAQVSQQEEEMGNIISAKREELGGYEAAIANSEEQAAQFIDEMEAQNAVLAEIHAQMAAMQAAEEAAAAAAENAPSAEEVAEAQAEAEAAEAAAAQAESEAQAAEVAAAEAQAAAEAAQAESEAQAAAEQAAAQAAEAKQQAETAKQQAEAAKQTAANTTEQANTAGTGGTSSTVVSGFVWPVPSSYYVSSEFGPREQPTTGASTYHQGIDIAAPTGTTIVAAAAGTVITSAYSVSAGNYIIINHGGGICTVYMHNSVNYVAVGQKVSAGESIAAMGSTGYSTGPHLHFGITVGGSYVNPRNYIG